MKEEGAQWKSKYEADAQLIFSHCQHHWHAKDSDGNRVPFNYCRVKKIHTKNYKKDNNLSLIHI